MIEKEVRERIRILAPGGGYCVGSGNSVPAYVPLAHFNAMRAAAFKYGAHPLLWMVA
jgi:uroporphyrinogen decarboxylase